ncbi:Sec-independent protein translocase subunit TatB [Microlunatus flavus]|uniref:Sec-independent protein translocase protein TatB n=1 Tax=Microlunatus flavus TaxID=1036181 RepID=A0A1H9KFN7_9ACTN|nr:Sec-independent protein translocase subunit TatB [Microlunatus flavus]SEQ97673.1 sec-independent protein translocase protein TatB [Microlunatus flavus]
MTPLLLDINGPEFALLIVLAVILFGPERLPDLARKAARLISFLRATANNAQQQLTRELGPEFQNLDFRDLNPRSFIQKNLLDNSLVADVKAEISGIGETLSESQDSVRKSIDGAADDGPNDAMAAATPDRTPFDGEAT